MTRRHPEERRVAILLAYQAGETLTAIGARFGITGQAVNRLARKAGLPYRERPAKAPPPVSARPGRVLRDPAHDEAPPVARAWCAQCERRVAGDEAARCASRFCKAGMEGET